jgi:hypothetical protein
MPFRELRQLLLFGVVLPRPMGWINHCCVPKLSKLLLQVETVEAQHLQILGQMPWPSFLSLHTDEAKYRVRISYTASKNEFEVLEYLETNIELICGEGALPGMQDLEVRGVRVRVDVGLRGNMPLLKSATYHLDCEGCSPVEVQKAETELRQASQAHHKEMRQRMFSCNLHRSYSHISP